MRRLVTISAFLAVGLLALTPTVSMAAPARTPALTRTTSAMTGIQKAVVGVSFLNAKQGYALMRTYSIVVEVPYRLDLYSTSDGGAAWHHVSLVRSSVTWGEDMPKGDDQLVFANDQDGLIWLNTSQVLVTHDGGLTWRSLYVDGVVEAAVPAGQSFILEVGQGLCNFGPLGTCAMNRLMSLPIDGYTRTTLKGVPTGMVQLGTQAVPLLMWSAHSVYISTDDGTVWLRRPLPDPHACYEPRLLYVTASGSSSLLFVCDNGGLLGPPPRKWFYRSTNGGGSWQFVAVKKMLKYGWVLGLDALTPDRVVMVTQYDILSTPDGGEYWAGTGVSGWPNGGLVCTNSNKCWAGWTAVSTNHKTGASTTNPAILRTTNGGRSWVVTLLRAK